MAVVMQFYICYPTTAIVNIWIMFLIIISMILSPALPEMIFRVDPLALLAGTLRTYQRAGCDSEQLSLSCPRGTSISIELAQYGRAGDLSDNSLCPPLSDEETTVGSDGVVHSKTEIEVKPPESCQWEHGLQYALLQTVVEACQKKRHCKFAATPKSAAGDPCPGIRKFVEIAYKCRPYEFRSKVACENDNMQLVCNPYSRIAIYSASFGRTQYESVQCSQPHDAKEESCLASWATETVMQICHGRRRCSLSADVSTFGNPCRSEAKMYLKVVYTCIPRKVLKDRYDTTPEPDEPQQAELDLDQDELYDEDQFYKESEAIPPAPKLQGGLPNNPVGHPLDFPFSEISQSTLIPPLLKRNDKTLEENQERFYLYIIISVSAGILLCLTLVIGRMMVHKRRIRKNSNASSNNKSGSIDGTNNPGGKFQKSTTGETQIPNGFSDDISEIDADIDLTTPIPVPSLSSRNESYMTYVPTTNCNYTGIPPPSSMSGHTSIATTMLMPSSGLVVTCPGGPGGRQPTPTPPNLIGGLPVNCNSMGGALLQPSTGISSVSHHTGAPLPSYLMMGPAPHHATLRRTMLPTSIGYIAAPSPPLTSTVGGSVSVGPLGVSGLPTQQYPGTAVYFDGTIPRNMARGSSTTSSHPSSDSTHYYG
ncbi:protein eva-1-like isoform X3 [Condylostylus longicornis]|uniref:protein eva-1-like isoform X3 n=1 Tax=Condylostylus longicornis TaxID=2530218 RepID=UPI00244E2E9D|nr:protein eva-1-like isoform X3 [Condylostylus longicornis]